MYLPGQSTMEMSFESVQFDADLFAMANQKSFAADAEYTTYRSEMCTVGTGKVVTLEGNPVAGTVRIGALKDGDGGELTLTAAVSGNPKTLRRVRKGVLGRRRRVCSFCAGAGEYDASSGFGLPDWGEDPEFRLALCRLRRPGCRCI